MKASLLLLAASLCLTLSCAELALRWSGYHGAPESSIRNIYPVADPILDWRYVPNSEVRAGRVVYRYNAAGYRDENHSIQKAPGIKRIVVVGDSVSEGYGVEWPHVFAHALQARLGATWEVINLAAGGLNSPQEVHLFEQDGRRYGPDLVVLNFVLNDADFETKFQGAERYLREKDSRIGFVNLPINPWLKQRLKSSALIYFTKERLERVKGRLFGTEEEPDHFSRIWAREENRDKVRVAFRQLATMRAEGRFDVLVMIWPVLTDFEHYRFESIHGWVAREAAERGFAVVDLLGAFSKFRYRDLQVTTEDNVHPNAQGHMLAVDTFVDWHRRRGPVASSTGATSSIEQPGVDR